MPYRRSLLFVPGARPERFEKAMAAGADAICIDLEDAVPPDAKEAARRAAYDFLTAGSGWTEVMVRLNSPRTPAGLADLLALVESDAMPAALMVPKVDEAGELRLIREVTGGAFDLVPVIESAEGLLNAAAICAAEGVTAALFGGADFSGDIGAELSFEPMLHARATLVVAAKRAGIELIDVPYLDVEDAAGLAAETARVKAMGFTARAAIHPRQVAAINEVFTPSAEEVAEAHALVEVFKAACGGPALYKGKMVEAPVIKAAERTLAIAERLQGH